MMKQLLRTAFCLLSGSALFACGPTKEPLTRQTLEAGFVTPPDSIQTSVYWYWMSNNLSKEGVVKDLQAMKKRESTVRSSAISRMAVFPTGRLKSFPTSGGISCTRR